MVFIVVPAGLSLRLRAAPATYSPAKVAAYTFSRKIIILSTVTRREKAKYLTKSR